MMEGFSIVEFIGITLVLFGGFAFMMGQAIGETWRPAWHNLPYAFLLGAGNHFIDCALFGADWGSLAHYLLNVAVALVISLLAFRITQARKMVSQYPWIYERNGLFGWKPKPGIN
jgi:hypothetical protein